MAAIMARHDRFDTLLVEAGHQLGDGINGATSHRVGRGGETGASRDG
jgi:hypothetical protein